MTVQTAHRLDHNRNHLIDALPAADRERWFGTLAPAFIATRRALFEPARAIDQVYFPVDAVISLILPVEDGAGSVEVATVGAEGIAGVPPPSDGRMAPGAVCQAGGWVLSMSPKPLLQAINGSAVVSEVVGAYLEGLQRHVTRAMACRRLHSNEERLSRWLLMRHDRIGAATFPIRHEFIAEMLGTPRTSVTVASRVLQAAGLIANDRGVVRIIDRPGLEALACECYGWIAAEIADAPTAELLGCGTRRGRVTSARDTLNDAHPETAPAGA